MMGILKRLAEIFQPRPAILPPTVRVTYENLEVLRGDEVFASIHWADIKKIITYKYDLLTYDTICIGFLTEKDADTWLEIDEGWHGFVEATEHMERLFPCIPKDWYSSVAEPPFQRKETVLYEEED